MDKDRGPWDERHILVAITLHNATLRNIEEYLDEQSGGNIPLCEFIEELIQDHLRFKVIKTKILEVL